ncbi:MAG: ABC transporter permease [Thiomonas arsenitoxydans]|uniref:Transport permease protein n=1 Tax=Thiomonas arsenitoxydans (strain DSM 22701 / CIP 110005 / 3As) TaxID=426114 RepID=A0A8I1MZ93_THIA3|nr:MULTISPECIES: ABC transporter permease [Thiomonas]MBN8745018.1 ABC transporter permease [Thiomonas arsenitoxydans]ODU95645.1 MAG: nodulation protein NodJ [Thiomonas sp. SCN 64-16]
MSDLTLLERHRWRFFPIWQRNFLVWKKLAIPSLIGNIAEPLITLLAFGFGVGALVGTVHGVPYIQFLASGAICMSVMMAASFEALYSAFSRMHVQKTWDAIRVTPTSLDDVLLGELTWAATKSVFSGVAILAVIVVLGISRQWTLLIALPLLLLTGLVFSAIGLIVNAKARGYDFFTYYFTLVLTPMTFLSGVYFPLTALPQPLQWLAQVLPLNAAVGLVRPLFFGQFDPQAGLHLAVLVFDLLMAWWVARTLTQRRFRA